MHPAINSLYPPSRRREGVWLGGVIQIHVSRACDLSCYACTQGSNLAGKVTIMKPAQFEQAVKSLGFGVDGQKPYFGIVGCFGGNPCLSPYFDDYCHILQKYVPFPQRGLWSNRLNGHGKIARETFSPNHSNVNVHMSSEAWAEFKSDWPEALEARKEHTLSGLTQDSMHGPPFVAIKDVIADEEERWKLIADCDISRWWSALLGLYKGEVRAWFCELAAAQSMLHQDDPDWPDTGMVPHVGWWKRPIQDFEAQVNFHCHRCGIPMRRPGIPAINGDHEQFSATHAAIARPKVKDRPVVFVGVESLVRSARPATEYLSGVTPGYRGS